MIVTGVETLTGLVVIVKEGDSIAPAGIVTDAGTLTTVELELLRVTTRPPGGAAEVNVTLLPVVLFPPTVEAEGSVNAAIELPIRVTSLAVLFETAISPPPETVATLVTLFGALLETLTVKVIGS